MAIIEAMTITDEIRKLIIARANTREMGKVAIGQGMRTLRMVALDRAREGISTLEQVLLLTHPILAPVQHVLQLRNVRRVKSSARPAAAVCQPAGRPSRTVAEPATVAKIQRFRRFGRKRRHVGTNGVVLR
jgi:hypothetical protein